MSDGSFSEKTRKLIKKRASNRCDICGSGVMFPHYHHRNPRGMGGTSNESLGLPSNGLYLHPNCHERVESKRWNSLQNGWLLLAADVPSQTPVLLWDGWHLLNDDGTLTPSDGPIE